MSVAKPKKISTVAMLLEKCAAFILGLMILHVVIDVVFKFLFNYPLPGTLNVVSSYYMVACVFLPIAMVELTRGNIAVDLFYQHFPVPAKYIFLILGTLLSLFFFALLGYQSVFDALKSYSKGEFIDGIVVVYVWPSRFILPVGLGIVSLVLIYRLIHELRYGEKDIVETPDAGSFHEACS